MKLTNVIKEIFWKSGFELTRATIGTSKVVRTRQLFQRLSINGVIDVGANSGQFACFLRKDIGYKGAIFSFEPLSEPYSRLSEIARHEKNWKVYNFALGDVVENVEINVSGNSVSSSLLEILPQTKNSCPESSYVSKENVDVRTLDSVFETLGCEGKNLYMKIDTQGFEERVLRGSKNSLSCIDIVQMEMSLVPLYAGETLFEDMYRFMKQKGYTLIAIDNGFSDPSTGQLLQLDGTFQKLGNV